MKKHLLGYGALAALAALVNAGSAVAQTTGGCGSLANAYGPYDYRTDRDRLPIVEGNHFTPEIEALVRGRAGTIGIELDYTLRAFPNHHRALISVMNYGLKMKLPQPGDLPRPVECYFERALRFRPDDGVARVIFAKYLASTNQKSRAERELETASAAAADNGFTQHNIGLMYFEMGLFEQALKQAHRAASLGFTGTVLRDQLTRSGQWRDAPPSSGEAAAAAPGASAPAQRAASAP